MSTIHEHKKKFKYEYFRNIIFPLVKRMKRNYTAIIMWKQSGPISKSLQNLIFYKYTKFDAFITKCTIHLKIQAKRPHY